MVLCASGDIFQSELDEHLGDIKGVKTYINNTMVVGKLVSPSYRLDKSYI